MPPAALDRLCDVIGVVLAYSCEDGIEVGSLTLACEPLDHDADFLTDAIVSDLVVRANQFKGFSLRVDVSLITPVSLRPSYLSPSRRKPWRHLLEEMRDRNF